LALGLSLSRGAAARRTTNEMVAPATETTTATSVFLDMMAPDAQRDESQITPWLRIPRVRRLQEEVLKKPRRIDVEL
jgi:hypothetical protein